MRNRLVREKEGAKPLALLGHCAGPGEGENKASKGGGGGVEGQGLSHWP